MLSHKYFRIRNFADPKDRISSSIYDFFVFVWQLTQLEERVSERPNGLARDGSKRFETGQRSGSLTNKDQQPSVLAAAAMCICEVLPGGIDRPAPREVDFNLLTTDRFNPSLSAETTLVTMIARRRLIDQYRKQSRSVEMAGVESDFDEQPD